MIRVIINISTWTIRISFIDEFVTIEYFLDFDNFNDKNENRLYDFSEFRWLFYDHQVVIEDIVLVFITLDIKIILFADRL